MLGKVCLAFIKVGAFAFGGGYAALSFIQKEIVELNGWIHPDEFVNIVAIAEMTPGPIAVNSSTFVGYNMFGVLGGILCTLCVVLVPFLLSLLMAVFFSKFKDNIYLKRALEGIRPAVIGIIGAACISIGKVSFEGLASVIIFIVAFCAVYKLKLNPILTLIGSGILGILTYGFIIPML